jgi:glycosyltransferase involved in cell wall biosynthesis
MLKKNIDILIPTYCRSEYLIKALKSIYTNKNILTLDKFNVIVSDNYSSDGTKDVLLGFKEKYNNFFFVSQVKNIGVERNILTLLSLATSDFIMFHSDDDLMEIDSIGKIINEIEANKNIGAIISPVGLFHINNSQSSSPTPSLPVWFDKDIKECKRVIVSSKEKFEDFFLRGTMLSGLAIKRPCNINRYNSIAKGSLYPQLYFLGMSINQGDWVFYKKPLVRALVGNSKEWEYDDDYMNSGVFNIINDIFLLSKLHVNSLKVVWKKRTSNSRSMFLNSIQRGGVRLAFSCFMGNVKIKAYRRSPSFYMYFIFSLFIPKFLLKNK